MKQFFKMAAKNEVGRVDIYDEIGFWGTTAATFARQWKELEAANKRIDLHIASPGGNLFDALAIYNLIQQSAVPVDVYIDGLCASSASLIAMAGRKNHMAENALLMMHNPYTMTVGGKKEHEASLRALDAATEATKVAYVRKSGKTDEEVAAIMEKETWYGAQEAKDEGFVDKVIKAVPMAAKFDMKAYGYSVPEEFRDRVEMKMPDEPAKKKEVIKMADVEKPDALKPATIPEIEAACDGCDEAFVLAQLKAQATLSQAQAAWTKVLAQRVKDATARADKLETEKKELETKASERTGFDPVKPKIDADAKPKTDAGGDVIAQWEEAVAAKVAKGMPKGRAISAVVKENPELHSAYLDAYNAGRNSA